MKIIIAYASCGMGHRIAAEALYDYIRENFKDKEVKIVDILNCTTPLFSYLYRQGYSFLVQYLRFIWALLYYLTLKNPYLRIFLNFLCYLNSRSFINYLLSERPDIVLNTHFFPLEIASRIKNKLGFRLITVITDFGVHPFWVNYNCDDYIVGSEYTLKQLNREGIPREKIKIFGIPLRKDFLVRYERKKEGFSVLILTGSFGFSLIEKIVEMLSFKINLYVVCGNNQRLHLRLKKKKYNKVRLFGFTNEIAKIMSEVDLVITKPGGLGIVEALAMDLPMLFIDGIPGQETLNAKVLESYGCGIRLKRLKEIKDLVLDLKKDSNRIDLMRKNVIKFKKPNATQEICNYVCSGSLRTPS
ncbi:MAG: hypothetical protein NC912_05820 [Candidatus Omnitrophica bacterium]|nr:hypothetical protein [Candidatus Omnitrophota bacterium]